MERGQPSVLEGQNMNGLDNLQQQMMDYSNMNQDLIDLFNAQEKLMQNEINAQKSRLSSIEKNQKKS